jgi:hypothetical protein
MDSIQQHTLKTVASFVILVVIVTNLFLIFVCVCVCGMIYLCICEVEREGCGNLGSCEGKSNGIVII